MLTEKKILANTKKYFETTQNLGIMPDELMTFLGDDFIKAPSATETRFPYAYEGGLIEYSLRVAFYAVRANNSIPDEDKVDQNSLLKVCLLHNIGKAKLFVENKNEYQVKNGKPFAFNNELPPMRVTERSLLYALGHGVKLTEEEYSAIILSDKTDDKQAELHNSILGELLKFGITFANKQKPVVDGE